MRKVKWILNSVRNSLQALRGGYGKQFFEFIDIVSQPNLKNKKVAALIELIRNDDRDLYDISNEAMLL